MLRRLDGLWYTSVADQRIFGCTDDSGQVIPNGLDLSQWAAVERRPEAGRWLLLGRPAAHKGHEDFFAAVSRMPLDKRPHTVDLVGAGTESQWRGVRTLAESMGISGVVVHGTVAQSDLLELVARCERAIFPSRYEGFGLGVVEMMAASVPVVVSDIAAHRERVVSGRCGCVIPFVKPGEAAEHLARLSKHTDDLAAGREQAMRFDWSCVVDMYERAYLAAMASR